MRNTAALLLVGLFPALAQPPKMDTILYGAAYYHEYMPYDRLDHDVELMKRAGLTVVRFGESTWTSWEPTDGHFEFAWMQRILDRLHHYFNYSGTAQQFAYAYAAGTDLLTGKAVAGSQTVTLGPWDLAIAEEADAPSPR